MKDLEYERFESASILNTPAFANTTPNSALLNQDIHFEEMDLYVNGINIHCGHWFGEHTTETVIGIPGLTANHKCWMTIAHSLVREGINFISLDLRGRGLSSKPRKGYGIDVHVDDIRAVIDELQLKKPVLIGHSLGAMIVMNFAAKYPDHLSKAIMMDAGEVLSLAQMVKAFSALLPSLSRLGVVFPTKEKYFDILRSSPMITEWNDTIQQHIEYEVEEVPGGWRCGVPAYVIDGEFESFGGGLDLFTVIRSTLSNPIKQLMKLWPSRYFPYDKIYAPILILRAANTNMEEGDEFLTEEGVNKMVRNLRHGKGVSVTGTNHYTIVFAHHPERDRAIIDFVKEQVSV